MLAKSLPLLWNVARLARVLAWTNLQLSNAWQRVLRPRLVALSSLDIRSDRETDMVEEGEHKKCG